MLDKLSSFKMPPEVKPAIWGAVGGALALAVVGFTWGGWVTGASADQRAKQLSATAVVAALAPICADKFRRQADASGSMAELKKINSWQQGPFIEKGGWATMPGSEAPDSSVARACAELLGSAKP